ncbi:MAG: serine hydrolase [Halobacteriales archaeon]
MGDTDLPTDRLDSFLRDWLAEEGLPGLSVAVVDPAELVYATGYGSRDLASNAPATGETLYGVGSVTKAFTALAVLQLHERGALDVADPIAEYVPFELGEDVTLHELLTHSSGLPSLAVSEALIARRAGLGEAGVPLGDDGDFYAHVNGAGDERVADPGEEFFYFNSGYTMLADAVEAADGRPFSRYVEQAVLAPLGMDRSTFDPERFAETDDAMTPYDAEEGLEPVDLPVRELSDGPGGLLASVADLGQFLRLQMGDGSVDGERLIDPESLDRMHAGHVDTPAGPYGYGWRRRDLLDRTLVGHAGSIGVSTAYVGFLPDEDLGVALACNAAPDHSLYHPAAGALAVLLGDGPEAVPFFERRERLDSLTGTYESYRGIRQATVERDGEVLRLAFEDAFPQSLVVVPDGDGFYTLAPDGTRRPVAFDESGDDVDLRYERWRLHRVGDV